MNRPLPRSLALSLVPVLILLCGYSCETPVAPGYRILRQSLEVHFVPGTPPELRIESQYKLQNVGNATLTFLDLGLPEEKSFGRKDLHVEVDGRAVAPASPSDEAPDASPGDVRIALESPWRQKEIRNLSIAYTLASPENTGSRITLGESEFHLGSRGWFPEPLPPRHLFAPNPKSQSAATYAVRVPSDFRVLARGTPKGQKKAGGEIEYRFELSKDDLAPFVVAGRYVSSPPDRHAPSAFWTLQPLTGDNAAAAAAVASAWSTLETDFGPLDKNIPSPHVVESPELRARVSGETGAAATAFPGGAIVNPAALALGTGSSEFLEIVTHALAHNWFGDELRPSSDSSIGIGEGLPEYATIVIDEARQGPAGRRRRVIEYLRRYDEARTRAEETPLGITMLTDPVGPRRIALAKAPLFYVALEDICGPEEVRRGLAHALSVLRGQEVGYNDLRSALEQSTNRNLGLMFRLWLNQKGIPQDFRDRYPLGPAGQQTGD